MDEWLVIFVLYVSGSVAHTGRSHWRRWLKRASHQIQVTLSWNQVIHLLCC